jgi:hypothetical protein
VTAGSLNKSAYDDNIGIPLCSFRLLAIEGNGFQAKSSTAYKAAADGKRSREWTTVFVKCNRGAATMRVYIGITDTVAILKTVSALIHRVTMVFRRRVER